MARATGQRVLSALNILGDITQVGVGCVYLMEAQQQSTPLLDFVTFYSLLACLIYSWMMIGFIGSLGLFVLGVQIYQYRDLRDKPWVEERDKLEEMAKTALQDFKPTQHLAILMDGIIRAFLLWAAAVSGHFHMMLFFFITTAASYIMLGAVTKTVEMLREEVAKPWAHAKPQPCCTPGSHTEGT